MGVKKNLAILFTAVILMVGCNNNKTIGTQQGNTSVSPDNKGLINTESTPSSTVTASPTVTPQATVVMQKSTSSPIPTSKALSLGQKKRMEQFQLNTREASSPNIVNPNQAFTQQPIVAGEK